MNALLHWFTSPEWSQLVKTLLHSLWQAALIAAMLALVLRRLTNPHWRYPFSLLALVTIPVMGTITWAVLSTGNHRPAIAPPPLPITTESTPAPVPLRADAPTTVVLVRKQQSAPAPFHWTAWLALGWLLGTGAMLGRAGIKVAGAGQLRRSCRPLDDPQLDQLVAEARRAVGLVRQIRVAVTDKLTSPAVVGVIVPTLIVPLALFTTLTPDQIRFILLHELAHIRRGDYLANLFQLFTEALLFFNPAVWWISHQVRREREACCDALAIELSGAPADYARTLVHVAENLLNAAPTAATAFGNEREPSSLADRVHRLLVPGYRPSLRLTWRAMATAFALGAVLLVLSAEGTRVVVGQISNSSPTVSQPDRQVSDRSLPNSESSPASEKSFSQEFALDAPRDPHGLFHMPTPVSWKESAEIHRLKVGLKTIRFERVSCSNKPLGELFRELSNVSQKLDKDGIGLRFSIIPVRVRTELATIEPPLTNANVLEILAAIQGNPRLGIAGLNTNGIVTLSPGVSMGIEQPVPDEAVPPITASGENTIKRETSKASNRTLAQTNSSGLFVRTFKVDPNTFWKGMESAFAAPVARTNVGAAVRDFFATLGLELNPPKSLYFNDHSGELLVRSTKADLELIEAALRVANKATPQVNIKVRFVEVEAGTGGLDRYLGTVGNNSAVRPTGGNPATGTASNSVPQSFTGILSDPQYQVVLRALDQRDGLDLLSEGEVTTLSGRQAQIQVVELSTIVNAAALPTLPLPGNIETNAASTNLYQTQVVPFGPVLDVIPTVSADGYTIQMTVIPTLTEFLGYDDPKKVLPSSPMRSKQADTLPLPRMRIRQVSTSATVWDGQTLVLGVGNDQLITKQPDGGIQKQKNPDAQKQLLVFITPTIIDPAGNRLRSASNTSKAAGGESFVTPTNLRPIIDRSLY